MVGATTGGMIHELNNLLSVVNGLVELLLEKLNADSEVREESADLLGMSRRELTKILV